MQTGSLDAREDSFRSPSMEKWFLSRLSCLCIMTRSDIRYKCLGVAVLLQKEENELHIPEGIFHLYAPKQQHEKKSQMKKTRVLCLNCHRFEALVMVCLGSKMDLCGRLNTELLFYQTDGLVIVFTRVHFRSEENEDVGA